MKKNKNIFIFIIFIFLGKFSTLLNASSLLEAEVEKIHHFIRQGWFYSASALLIQALSSDEFKDLKNQKNLKLKRLFLMHAENLLQRVGWDHLREILGHKNQLEFYSENLRNQVLYQMAKDALLIHKNPKQTIEWIQLMRSSLTSSSTWVLALSLRATSYALLGQNSFALADFDACEKKAGKLKNIKARCTAGKARVFYQMNQFQLADRAYDEVPRGSWIWPEILFEQAWTAFSRKDWNRALGKLVSYQSPTLQFAEQSEGDVLKAQSYLSLCLYADVEDSIAQFQTRYTRLFKEVDPWIQTQGNVAFFELGKKIAREKIPLEMSMKSLLARVVRSDSFQFFLTGEKKVLWEIDFLKKSPSLSSSFDSYLRPFLNQTWNQIRDRGGFWLKKILIEELDSLKQNFDKISFIQLENLKMNREGLKKRLSQKQESRMRERGNQKPNANHDQFLWSFDGEFWLDEMGQYVFALESECH